MNESPYRRFFWIKLKRDFFKRHDVRIIESMPNGEIYVLFYLKMLAESVDHDGALRFSDLIPYTPEMLSAVFYTKLDIVNDAIKLFQDLGMLEIEPDGTIKLTKFDDFVGCETESAVQKRRQRNLPTLLNGSKRVNGSTLETPDGKRHHVDDKRFGGNGMLALDRAGGKCEICGKNDVVVIHHNNGYSNELDDLIVLCLSCHGKAHNKTNKGHLKIDRPPYVGQMSAECPPNVRIENREKRIENREKRIENREKTGENKNIKNKTNNIFLQMQGDE